MSPWRLGQSPRVTEPTASAGLPCAYSRQTSDRLYDFPVRSLWPYGMEFPSGRTGEGAPRAIELSSRGRVASPTTAEIPCHPQTITPDFRGKITRVLLR